MRFTADGTAITRIFIAEKHVAEIKEYKTVITWAELAEQACTILETSQEIYAKGYWKTRTWEGTDGSHHSKNEFTAKQIWIVNGEKFIDVMEIKIEPEKEDDVPF